MNIKNLTKKEEIVCAELFKNKSLKKIALDLGLSDSAVKFHAVNIYKKCGVKSRIELLIKFDK